MPKWMIAPIVLFAILMLCFIVYQDKDTREWRVDTIFSYDKEYSKPEAEKSEDIRFMRRDLKDLNPELQIMEENLKIFRRALEKAAQQEMSNDQRKEIKRMLQEIDNELAKLSEEIEKTLSK